MPDLFSPNFFIGDIHIGTVQEASSINIGNNTLTDFTSNKKHNQGFGSVGGDKNHFSNARAFLYDPDVIDQFGDPGSEDVPDWVKQKILEESNR